MATMTSSTGTTTTWAEKYLTFALGNESYGISVLKVREIIKLAPITAVPQMPDYVQGVINLRGKIIPVIDLRLKFGLPPSTATEHSCIVVAQVTGANSAVLNLGLVVDGVEEVMNIAATDIEAPPDFGTVVDNGCIVGMAKIKGAIKTLLDVDRAVGRAALTDLAVAMQPETGSAPAPSAPQS